MCSTEGTRLASYVEDSQSQAISDWINLQNDDTTVNYFLGMRRFRNGTDKRMIMDNRSGGKRY